MMDTMDAKIYGKPNGKDAADEEDIVLLIVSDTCHGAWLVLGYFATAKQDSGWLLKMKKPPC